MWDILLGLMGGAGAAVGVLLSSNRDRIRAVHPTPRRVAARFWPWLLPGAAFLIIGVAGSIAWIGALGAAWLAFWIVLLTLTLAIAQTA